MERLLRYLDRKYNKREQIGMMVAGIVLTVFLFFKLIVSPIAHKKSSLKENLTAKKGALAQMVALEKTYNKLQQGTKLSKRRFFSRDKKFTLFSFLDELAGRSGIKENISYMKPASSKRQGGLKKSIVEMKLNDITLNQLTSYLHGIETSRNMVFVKRLSISKKGKQDQFITVVLQAETVES